MTMPPVRRAPLELYGSVNAIDSVRVAAEIPLTAAPKAGKLYYACVSCASSDALHKATSGSRIGFKCFSCGEWFTNVDLAAAAWAMAPGEACVVLAERLGIPIPEPSPGSGRGTGTGPGRRMPVRPALAPRPVRPVPSPPDPALVATRATVYAAVLRALTLTDRGASYIDSRGIPSAAAAHYGFRSVDGAEGWGALVEQLVEQFAAEELDVAGLQKGPWRTEPRYGRWDRQPPALLIPYALQSGLAAIRFRNLEPLDKNDRYRTLGGANPSVPFNAAALDDVAGDELHIVEGEVNALTLGLYGLRTIGVPGAAAWKAEWTPLLASAGRVIVWFDNDPPVAKPDGRTDLGAGDKARAAFAAEISRHFGGTWMRGRCRTATLARGADGQKRDANDLHVSGQLHALLTAAPWRS